MKKLYLFVVFLLSVTLASMVLTGGGNSPPIESVSGNWIDYREPYSGGGTEANPYIIDTPGKLAMISYETAIQNNFVMGYFKLTENLDMGAHYFTPIGNGPCFGATFDGNYKIVSNVYISASKMDVGLFGTIDTAKILRLGISGFDISVHSDNCIGALIGSCVSSTVDECFVANGTILNDGGSNAGGLIGYSSYGTITNSFVSDVTINNTYKKSVASYKETAKIVSCDFTSIVNEKYIGGGASGHSEYSCSFGCNLTIEKVRDEKVYDVKNVCGILGYEYSNRTLANCYFSGTINSSVLLSNTIAYRKSGYYTSTYNSGPQNPSLTKNDLKNRFLNSPLGYFDVSKYNQINLYETILFQEPVYYYPNGISTASHTNCYYYCSTKTTFNSSNVTNKEDLQNKTTSLGSCFASSPAILNGNPHLKNFYWENMV